MLYILEKGCFYGERLFLWGKVFFMRKVFDVCVDQDLELNLNLNLNSHLCEGAHGYCIPLRKAFFFFMCKVFNVCVDIILNSNFGVSVQG